MPASYTRAGQSGLSDARLLPQLRALTARGEGTRDARVAAGSMLLFANTLAGAVLGVLFWTMAARLFSVAEVGFNTAVVSTATLVATFANLGMGAVAVRYLPTAERRGRALCLVATTAPAAASALLVGVGMAFPYWPLASDLLAGGVWGVLLPAALAVSMSVMFVQDSIFIARRQAGYVLVRGVGAALARFALLLPFAGAGPYGLMGVFLGGTCVSVALGARAWGAQPGEKAGEQAHEGRTPSPGEMARYGGSNYLAGLFAQAPQLLYPALIASQVSHSAAGAFSFAWMAGAMLLQLPPSAANVLMSQLVRDPGDAERRIGQVTRLVLAGMAALALLVGLGVALFATLFLPAAAGEITAYLPLLLGGTLPFAWIRMRSMSMSLRGELRKLTLLNGMVATFSVALPLALLPAYGVFGLEAGWAGGQLAGVALALLLSRWRERDAVSPATRPGGTLRLSNNVEAGSNE